MAVFLMDSSSVACWECYDFRMSLYKATDSESKNSHVYREDTAEGRVALDSPDEPGLKNENDRAAPH
jgi:hypothetical protein